MNELDSKGGSSPPRLAARWLAWALGPGVASESTLGDFYEEFCERAHRAPRRARAWYWWVALLLGVERGLGRLRSRSMEVLSDETVRGMMRMTGFWSDLRFGLRSLGRAPGFTVVTLCTLGLGIGATSAIFAVVNGVLLKPLPFDEPEELVGVWHAAPGMGFEELGLSAAMYFTYQDLNQGFEELGCWDGQQVSVTGLDEPERLAAMNVTASLLRVLRVQPLIGRGFSQLDDSPGAPETVMLSQSYWVRQFGSDPGVLGRMLRVDGRPREIIGVLPSEFTLPRQDADIFMPFQWDRARALTGFNFQAIARLRSGTTIDEANADVDRMLPISAEMFPGGLPVTLMREFQFAAYLRPLQHDFVGDVGRTLWIVLGTVAMVLLIACANVANLFLVRTEGRHREVAIRTAIGAGRAQVTRQLLLEGLLLGLVGGVVGLGLAYGGVRLLVWMGPESLPRLEAVTVDSVVLGFTLVVSLVSCVLFGLFPALRVAGGNLSASLKEGTRGGGGSKQRHGARQLLVVTQVALAVVLLTGSGLMIRSFQALRDVDPGVADPEGVLSFRLAVPAAEIGEIAEVALAYEDIVGRLQEIPGVSQASASSSLPLEGHTSTFGILLEDFPLEAGEAPPITRVKWIGGGYFETMRTPILAGRQIEWDDVRSRAPVAVVTENFAVEHWGSAAAAIGKGVRQATNNNLGWREIVGVVGDIQDDGLDEPAPPVVFWPLATANVFRADDLLVQRAMSFAVRGDGRPASDLIPEVRAAVRAVNSSLPLADVRTLEDILGQSMARTSFTLVMLTIAAAAALALGVVGVYGVISYVVSQRAREIGVRLALGAGRREVRRMVLRQGLVLASVGVVVGLAAATGLTRVMSSLLFGVEATDPVTFIAVGTAMTTVALVASYVPAARASGTDPLIAFRTE